MGSYITALVMDAPRIPLKGETLTAGNFRSVHGGKGSNQAVQAARLGAETHFVTRVGDDSYAQNAADLMQEEQVQAHFVQDPQAPTAIAFIITSSDGHNIITLDLGSLDRFEAEDVAPTMPVRYRHDRPLAARISTQNGTKRGENCENKELP